jgi:CHASE3 domain sensor protein
MYIPKNNKINILCTIPPFLDKISMLLEIMMGLLMVLFIIFLININKEHKKTNKNIHNKI